MTQYGSDSYKTFSAGVGPTEKTRRGKGGETREPFCLFSEEKIALGEGQDLGRFAGVFLYLGASSLLPAAHDASHSRLPPLATLAGVAFIYGAQLLAPH